MRTSHLELSSYTICPRHQDGINKSCEFKVKQTSEAPQVCVTSWCGEELHMVTMMQPFNFIIYITF